MCAKTVKQRLKCFMKGDAFAFLKAGMFLSRNALLDIVKRNNDKKTISYDGLNKRVLILHLQSKFSGLRILHSLCTHRQP
jgi:hypothetical protein